MRSPLSARVDKAFPAGEADPFALQYLAAILETRREIHATMRRTVLLLVALVVITELLLSNRVGEIVVLGVRISDSGVARALAPALVAYLLYDLCSAMAASIAYADLRDALVRRVAPAVHAVDLHRALKPGTLTFLLRENWAGSGRTAGWVSRLDTIAGVGLLVGPYFYVIGAYVRLIRLEGGGAVVVVSVAFAAFMIVRASPVASAV